MKILRYYWSPEKSKHICDLALSVVRETKTQLVAISRANPKYEYRFRKPSQFGNGMYVSLVGKQERFSQYHYEMELE